MKQSNRSQNKNSFDKPVSSTDWQKRFEYDFCALLAVADKHLGRDERSRLTTFIQSLIQEAEERGYCSHEIWKETQAGDYEPAKRKGARQAVEKILDDLSEGINAAEGDMRDAKEKGDNLEFYQGYIRALHFAFNHVMEIGENMGVTGLGIK